MSLLARLQAASDGSPYLFLSVERLGTIAVELEAKGGKLGANYELINNFHRRFDEIQIAARALLAKARGVETEALPWQRGTFHDFRRTYGTRLARVVPIHVLKEYMGHAKIQTTQEYYLAAETQEYYLAAETQDGDRAREAINTMLSTSTAFPRDARISRAMEPKPGRDAESKNDKPLRSRGLRSEADGTRTRNHRIDSQPGESRNHRENADLRNVPPAPAAPTAAPAAEPPLPPDLAAVVAAWPALPPAIRAGIAAMVQVATG